MACCRFVLGSNYRTECGELMMELGILGKLEHGKLELVDMMALVGTLELACMLVLVYMLELVDMMMVDIRKIVEVARMIEVLRSRHCRSYRKGLRLQEHHCRQQLRQL